MRYNLVVATHHKTGTVWMDGVFKALADPTRRQILEDLSLKTPKNSGESLG